MANRRRALAPRLYTYEKLESLMRLFHAGKRSTILYGGVAVGARPSGDPPYLEITYSQPKWWITLARVYRGEGNSTVYAVTGPPRSRDKQLRRQQLAAWKRHVLAFTPHRVKRLLGSNACAWYRVKDGASVRCRSKPGLWLHDMRRAKLLSYAPDWGKEYPYLRRRTKFFVSRIRAALASMPDCMIVCEGEGCESDCAVRIYTPPTPTEDGKLLVVRPYVHNDESRHFHQIDEDFAVKNIGYRAYTTAKHSHRPAYRWKCSKDAINGVVEWVLGDIYIPGPG